MKPDGSDSKKLTNNPDFPIVDAKWSPDGYKIAIVSPVGGDVIYGPAIYIVDADGRNRYLLTNRTDYYMATGEYPVWSPGSKSFVYILKPNRDMYNYNKLPNNNEIKYRFDPYNI